MRCRRYVCFVLLTVLASTLSGCVYLRLLKTKLQLAEFEKNFTLENRHALAVTFLNPLLQKKDILHVAKRGPSLEEETPEGSMWQYDLVKVYPPGQEGEGGAYDVSARLFFRENTLYRGTFPERFYHQIPRAFIVEASRALGRAQVDPINRYAKGEFHEQRERNEIPLPGKEDFLRLLGKPHSEKNTEDGLSLTYIYRLQKGKPDPQPPTDAWLRLLFMKGNDALSAIEAKFAGMRLTLSLR